MSEDTLIDGRSEQPIQGFPKLVIAGSMIIAFCFWSETSGVLFVVVFLVTLAWASFRMYRYHSRGHPPTPSEVDPERPSPTIGALASNDNDKENPAPISLENLEQSLKHGVSSLVSRSLCHLRRIVLNEVFCLFLFKSIVKVNDDESQTVANFGSEDHVPVDDGCSICLTDYQHDDRVTTSTRCRHVFHHDCILAWISLKQECPSCRESYLDPKP